MNSNRSPAVFSEPAQRFMADVKAWVTSTGSEDVASRVRLLVSKSDEWRERRCLNLTPAENILSRSARRLLDSDLATRLTEGVVGDKDYPAKPQNQYIDEIEGVLISLAQELFGARYVEWRPISNSMANAIVFFSLTQPGDVILSQSKTGGGNYSYQAEAAPGIARLRVEPIPHRGDLFEIDIEATRASARKHRPRLIVVGGSYMLFELPVAELSAIAEEVGAILVYDAAHASLPISAGLMSNPLSDGAHVMTLSTHKVMSGAVGGMVLCNDPGIAEPIVKLTFPTFMQTRDLNKYAATAHAFAEMREHGRAYAAQMVENAQALAVALEQAGLKPLARDRGYTQTHQVVIDLKEYGARPFTQKCRDANILLSAEHLAHDVKGSPGGTRISTQEITRRGMKAADMPVIATLIRRAALGNEPSESIAAEVAHLMSRFQRVHYSFDNLAGDLAIL